MEEEENDSYISAMLRGGAGFLLGLGSLEGCQRDGHTSVATLRWHQPSLCSTGISDQGGMYAKLSKYMRLAPCCPGPAGSQEGLEMDHQSQREQ